MFYPGLSDVSFGHMLITIKKCCSFMMASVCSSNTLTTTVLNGAGRVIRQKQLQNTTQYVSKVRLLLMAINKTAQGQAQGQRSRYNTVQETYVCV